MRTLLCVTVLTAGLAMGAASAAPKKVRFGPVEHLSGIFFSNFENATFFLCPSPTEKCPAGGDNGYLLKCDRTICGGLEAAIREAARPPDQTVWLALDFLGRRSMGASRPQFIGDPGRSITVQRIEKVRVVPPPA
jgi:hypothetical protein